LTTLKFCLQILFAVKFCREELNLLQEPASHVGEVVKVMSKSKVLVKVHLLSLLYFSGYLMEHYFYVEKKNDFLPATSESMLLKNNTHELGRCGLFYFKYYSSI
jgi:hypothetical protein